MTYKKHRPLFHKLPQKTHALLGKRLAEKWYLPDAVTQAIWLHHAEPQILPDIAVAAKPLACGLPLGVIMANEKAAKTIGPGMHGTTFGGGPLACRVALEFLDILKDQLTHIHHTGGYFRMELSELARHHSFIKEVRGFGLMIGMELDIPGKQFVTDAMEEGLLINCTHDTVLRFLPPYIISEQEIDKAVKILAKVFKRLKPEVGEHVPDPGPQRDA